MFAGVSSALCWALLVLGLLLWTSGDLSPTSMSGQQAGQGGLVIAVLYTLAWLEVSAVGALIAWRQARSPIGWLTLAASVLAALQSFGNGYADFAVEHTGLPGWLVLAWGGSWIGAPALGLVVLVLLLVPTGRLLFSWTRVVAALAVVGSLAQAAGFAFQPGPLRGLHTVSNPFSTASAAQVVPLAHDFGTAGLVLSMLAAAILLSIRLRRATGKERQQLKWVAYAAVLFAFGVGTLSFAPTQWNALAAVLFALTGTGLTTAVGIAMLRYQLFDIDVLINRTLIYGCLIVTLVVAYAGAVVLLQVLLSRFTRGSEIAIAVSTLGVAVLFGPALRRIRDAVDRRFYRRRYDAARTLEAFSIRLRQDVDLDGLADEFLRIVQESVQPTQMALWLRPTDLASRGAAPAPERK
jgi:hypothetical protein